jgi:hypothetical protein
MHFFDASTESEPHNVTFDVNEHFFDTTSFNDDELSTANDFTDIDDVIDDCIAYNDCPDLTTINWEDMTDQHLPFIQVHNMSLLNDDNDPKDITIEATPQA